MHIHARNFVKKKQGRTATLQKNQYLQCYIKRLAASKFFKQSHQAQTIGEVALEQFLWMHSGFEMALKQPEQPHTGFHSKWFQGSHFECTVASKWLQSNHFEHIVASKCLQSSHFERTVASKWLKWLLCVASNWLESSHFEQKWLLRGFRAGSSSALWPRSGSSGSRT